LSTQSHRLGALETRLRLGMRGRAKQSLLTLQGLEARWQRAMTTTLEQRQWRLQAWASRLEAANPRGVLKRGYAWVARPDGRPVTRAGDLLPGDPIDAVFDDGLARATVNSVLSQPADPDAA
jgi:exodeoxyribonuclease VII large subunit